MLVMDPSPPPHPQTSQKRQSLRSKNPPLRMISSIKTELRMSFESQIRWYIFINISGCPLISWLHDTCPTCAILRMGFIDGNISWMIPMLGSKYTTIPTGTSDVFVRLSLCCSHHWCCLQTDTMDCLGAGKGVTSSMYQSRNARKGMQYIQYVCASICGSCMFVLVTRINNKQLCILWIYAGMHLHGYLVNAEHLTLSMNHDGRFGLWP